MAAASSDEEETLSDGGEGIVSAGSRRENVSFFAGKVGDCTERPRRNRI